MFFRVAQDFWTEFRQIPTKITRDDCEVRSIRFPTTSGSAHTLWTIHIQRQVPKLTRDVIRAAQHLAINYASHANAVRNRNVSKAVGAAVAALKPQLGQRTRPGRVFNLYRESGHGHDSIANINPGPTKRRSVQNFSGALVDHPKHYDANTLATRLKCFILGHSTNSQRQVLDEGGSRKDRIVGFQCEFSAGKITEHEIGFAETDIDCNRQPVMRPDMQERRLATAQRFAGDSFIDNILVHQFLDQHAHYAAGHIHSPREVSSGNRLVLANKIQRNPPIDISRRGAGGYAKISGIDLSH